MVAMNTRNQVSSHGSLDGRWQARLTQKPEILKEYLGFRSQASKHTGVKEHHVTSDKVN